MTSLGRIAFRNVLRNRRRSLITFSALFLAVLVMVSLRGLANGLVDSIGDAMVRGRSGALQVHPRGHLRSLDNASLERNLPADEAFLARVLAVPGVAAVSPRLTFGAMANARDTTAVALFAAFAPALERRVCPQRAEMASTGTGLEESGAESGVFSPELAAAVGVGLGERAILLASDVDGSLNAVELEVVGTYGQPGLPTPEKKLGFVPLGLAQSLLRLEGRASELAVAVHDLRELEAVRARLQAALGEEYEVSTWKELAPFLESAIATNEFMLGLVSAIFLFVALLGVVNTMLIAVHERTREIGTMMSVGARRRQILRLFLLEAGMLGFLGGALGALAGGGLVLALAQRGVAVQLAGMSAPIHLHPSASLGYIATMVAVATVGAVAAAAWPSLRASRLRPVQALASV